MFYLQFACFIETSIIIFMETNRKNKMIKDIFKMLLNFSVQSQKSAKFLRIVAKNDEWFVEISNIRKVLNYLNWKIKTLLFREFKRLSAKRH